VANYCTHGPTLALLKHLGAKDRQPEEKVPKTEPVEILVKAADHGDLDGIESALRAGAPVDGMTKTYSTAMGAAVFSRHFDAVDLLLRHGANINSQSPKLGYSFMHALAEYGADPSLAKLAAETIEKVVARGANPNMQMKDGTTPLMAASKKGLTGAGTEALLKAGANINLRNKEGLTALGVARKFGRAEMIEFLKERGAVD
jgi:ankyrin repeat protein